MESLEQEITKSLIKEENKRNSAMLEDTFLADKINIYPESQILVNCSIHNMPAVFYSKAHDQFKCFKCLVEQQDLIYIDKQFKKEMEEFDRVKYQTAELLKVKQNESEPIKKWKAEIRKCLISVREQFIGWIDNFTNKFVDSLKNIERQPDMAKFQGYDKILSEGMISIENQYLEIMKIFKTISQAKPDYKIQTIDKMRPEISKIDQEVQRLDQDHKEKHTQVMNVLQKNIRLNGLEIKLQDKMLNFLERKMKETSQRDKQNPHKASQLDIDLQNQTTQQKQSIHAGRDSFPIVQHSNLDANNYGDPYVQGIDAIDIEYSFSEIDRRDSIPHLSFTQQVREISQFSQGENKQNQQQISAIGAAQQPTQKIINQNASQQQQVSQPSQNQQNTMQQQQMAQKTIPARLTESVLMRYEQSQENHVQIDQKVKHALYGNNKQFDETQVSHKYRHKNQNSIYYLKPKTTDVYFLDFKKQGFVKERIDSNSTIPYSFSSIQIPEGHIYLVGGQVNEHVSKSCVEIDPNLLAEQKEPLKQGRYNCALVLVRDRYIFAIGGLTGKTNPTQSVEVYDVNTNNWYNVPSMEKARAYTSACVMNQKQIYVFPGQASNSWSTIEFLDLGTTFDVKHLKPLKWQLLQVGNPDFVCSYAFGSYQLNQTEILIFGGSKKNTFIFDTSDLQNPVKQKTTKQAKLTTLKQSPLCVDGFFGYDSDYMSRGFSNFLYSIDSHSYNLHVFSMKDKLWNYSSLQDLGIAL